MKRDDKGDSTGGRLDRWLRAMGKAVEERTDLLSVVLPRVSPEYLAVTLCLHGLLREIRDGTFDVKMEAPFPGGRRGKCDAVIAPRDRSAPFFLEFKALWPRGVGENAKGIRRDLRKLEGLDGAVVAFSFALSEVPTGSESHLCQHSLESAIEGVSERLKRLPTHSGKAFDVKGDGMVGRACLVAWTAAERPA